MCNKENLDQSHLCVCVWNRFIRQNIDCMHRCNTLRVSAGWLTDSPAEFDTKQLSTALSPFTKWLHPHHRITFLVTPKTQSAELQTELHESAFCALLSFTSERSGGKTRGKILLNLITCRRNFKYFLQSLPGVFLIFLQTFRGTNKKIRRTSEPKMEALAWRRGDVLTLHLIETKDRAIFLAKTSRCWSWRIAPPTTPSLWCKFSSSLLYILQLPSPQINQPYTA